ncbi:MAG: Uma2 family endonuclease [Rhodomicrobium sp.]|nr:Uma2 family endonuclease [Rhodomicrobium sp.]
MGALAKQKMTVDEFLAWAEGHEGRFELQDGEVVSMSPQQVGHALIKMRVVNALAASISRAGLDCHALPDGITVRVNRFTAFEPDALVHCGDLPDLNALEVPNPIIVVEVLSPTSMRRDLTEKVAGYFKVQSIRHYLIVDPEGAVIIHHSRSADGIFPPKIIREGEIDLSPPGLELNAADLLLPV